MTEHKSNLKALEPVEIRLAAAVRVRHEIARLREVEEALDISAREIALSVVGSPEVVDVVLKVVGSPFADGPDLYDQSAVESFLAENHELRLGGAAQSAPAQSAPAPVGAPAGGAAEAPRAAAGGQPQDGGPGHQAEGEAPSAAAAVAARLSAYEVDLPEDYFGVTFDMIKRPEANLIMGEAVLAAIDGLSLDASPYKADRGKVHWRRKLFEETFQHFEANPPRPRAVQEPEPASPSDGALPSDASSTAEGPVVHAPTVESEAEAAVIVPPVIQPETVAAPVAAAMQSVEREAAPGANSPSLMQEAAPGAGSPALVQEPVQEEGEGSSADLVDGEASEVRLSEDPVHGGPAGDGPAGMSTLDLSRSVPTSGKIIEFPGAPSAPQDAGDPDDLLDPFESSLPLRTLAPVVDPSSHGSHAEAEAEDEADALGEQGDGTPTYDGPDWEGPAEDETAHLERTFDDRIHYDPRESTQTGVPVVRNDGLDPAAAAALAEAAAPSVPEERETPRLPVGGVPPRPPIPMPTSRPAPPAPPRPAVAPPGAQAAAVPPTRPALAGAAEGGRVAPRPVAVRPPGL